MASEDVTRPHPPSLSPTAVAIAGWSALVFAGLAFMAIAWNVTAREAFGALDIRVANWLHAHAGGAAQTFFFAVTHLHSPAAIMAWCVVFGLVLAKLRERYWILTLAAAVAGGMLLNGILKTAYERVRPKFDDPLLVLDSYSFPSGHTAGAVLFYGVLAAFLVSRSYDWRRRAACVGGAVVAVLLVAFSRMYLGAHYLSDVLAAMCSSTAWLALCLAGGHALVRKRLKLHTVVVAVTIVLLIAAGTFMPREWWGTFEDVIEDMNPLAGFAVFSAAYAAALLLLLPAWVFPVAAGAIFGFAWGTAAALAGVAVSAVLGLVLARYVAPARLQRAARRNETFKAIDHAVAKEPWKFVALLRLAPAIPCGLKTYFLGLTRVEPRTYLSASMAGMAPDLLVKVYLGAAGRGALGGGGVLHWVMLGGGVVALFALWFIVGRKLRARLKL